MQAFLRSRVTEGAALLTAGAIALSPVMVAPVADHLPALHVSNVATTLAASVNPIQEWVDVLNTTFANISALGTQVQADPTPILDQLLANQTAYATTAFNALSEAGGGLVAGLSALPQALLTAGEQLAAGKIADATDTIFQAGISLVLAPAIGLLPIFNIPGQIAQNVANVLTALPNAVLPIGLAAISPIAGVFGAVGDTGQAVFDALKAGDIPTALNAIVNAPAVITNALLNGYEPRGTVGLLSVGADFSAGLVSALLSARNTIAVALGAPAPTVTAAARAATAPAAATAVESVTAPAAPAQTEAAETPAVSSGGVKTRAATTDPANSTTDASSEAGGSAPVTEKSVAGVGRSRSGARAGRDSESSSSDNGGHSRASGGSARSAGE